MQLMKPVSTWTRCSILAAVVQHEPDTGLFMCLNPHRVPDRSHPCQHQSQNREFPLTETLVITVYSTAVTTLCLLHLQLTELLEKNLEGRGTEDFGAACEAHAVLLTVYRPHSVI